MSVPDISEGGIVWLLIVGIPLLCLYVALIYLTIKRKAKRLPTSQWRLYPYGGGGAIPYDATSKNDAIEYCAKTHGTVMFVDETHEMIFYKPNGFTKN